PKNRITKFDRPCYRTGGSNQLFRCAGESLGTMYGAHFLRDHSELPEGVPADQFQVNDDGLLVWVGEGNSWKDGVAKGLWGTQTEINGRTYQWGHPILQYDSTGNPAIV